MAITFGGTTVLSIRWARTGEGEQLVDITRNGVDGVAFQKTGERSEPSQATIIVDCDSGIDADSTFNTIKAMQGTLITIVDDFGATTNYVAVTNVRKADQHTVLTAVGGVTAGSVLLTINATLRET